MKNWAKQVAGAVLVLVFALAVGGFVMVLRAQQGGLAATMAAAHIRAVSPPEGATNVPLSGEIRADYVSRPAHDPTIKLEPPVGVTLDNPQWDGATFIIDYRGLRDDSLYHVSLDQDDWSGKGEHKQIKVRWSFRTGPLRVTAPTLTPTPRTSLTPAPSSSPPTTPDLIWYWGTSLGSSANNGVDWNGKQVKTTKSVANRQSPNGRLLYNSVTPSTEVYDADGNRVASIASYPAPMWADDSRQFCGISNQSVSPPRSLVTMPLAGSVHTVAPIALQDSASKPAQSVSLAACSDLAGRAVVIGGSSGYVWSMAMISLTDGGVIYQTRYPNPLARIVASHDGQYIAEQLASNANGGPVTLIRQLPSGTLVGQLSGILVQGFSWDGSLVVGSTFGNPTTQEAQVFRWRTHETVWHQCMCPHPHWLIVLAQPGGSKVAVVASTDDGAHVSFNIVDANGTSQPVPFGSTPLTPLF